MESHLNVGSILSIVQIQGVLEYISHVLHDILALFLFIVFYTGDVPASLREFPPKHDTPCKYWCIDQCSFPPITFNDRLDLSYVIYKY